MTKKQLITSIVAIALLALCIWGALVDSLSLFSIRQNPSTDPLIALIWWVVLILWLCFFCGYFFATTLDCPNALLRSAGCIMLGFIIALVSLFTLVSVQSALTANIALTPNFLSHNWAYATGQAGSLLVAKGQTIRPIIFTVVYSIVTWGAYMLSTQRVRKNGTAAKMVPLVIAAISMVGMILVLSFLYNG